MSTRRTRERVKSLTDRTDATINADMSIESIESVTDEDRTFGCQAGIKETWIRPTSEPILSKIEGNQPSMINDKPREQEEEDDDDDDELVVTETRRVRKSLLVESQEPVSPMKSQKFRTVSDIVKNFSQPIATRTNSLNSNETSPIKRLRFGRRKADEDDSDSDSGFDEQLTTNKKQKLSRQKKLPLELKRTNSSTESIGSSKPKLPWVQLFSPSKSSEICIHEKKLEDVRKRITELVCDHTSRNRILVVSGPSGSGKSTTVKLLCEEIMEQNPVKEHFNSNRLLSIDLDTRMGENQSLNDTFKHVIEYKNLSTSTSRLTSSVTYFSEFLNQCKFLTSQNAKCIVVEELPNLYHYDTLKNFQQSLLDWVELSRSVNLPPLIICITEVEIDDEHGRSTFSIDTNFKTETVLGAKLMAFENNGWSRIKFNPVAKKYIKRCLDRIMTTIYGSSTNNSNRKIPRLKVNEKIEELSKIGDLRNAINLLEYWYKFLYTSKSSSQMLGKETGLNVFHSVGKIIYGTQHPLEEMINFKKRNYISSLTLSPEDGEYDDLLMRSINSVTVSNVTNDIVATSSNFQLNLLENYSMVSRGSLSSTLVDLVDDLSLSDVLMSQSNLVTSGSSSMNNVVSLAISSYIGCLGVRLKCEAIKAEKSTGGASSRSSSLHGSKMRYTRDAKIMKKQKQIQSEIDVYQSKRGTRSMRGQGKHGPLMHISDLDVMLIDGFYEASILGSKKMRMRSQKLGITKFDKTRRLGGDFQNLTLADSEFSIVDDNEKKEMSDQTLKELESLYFGFNPDGDDDQPGRGENASEDEEFDLDPIVESGDEDTNLKSVENNGVEESDWDDDFSDDSLVMKL